MAIDLIESLIADWERERPDLDASPMAIVGRVLRLSKLLEQQIGQALRPFDIHYTDFDVLATLRRSGAPFCITPTELRRSVLITSGAMTAVLRRLKNKGLVKRTPGQEDRRVLAVALTAKGRRLVDQAVAVRFEQAAENVTLLGKQELRRVAESLSKLLEQAQMSERE